jgi:hypothetical protein
VLTIQGFQMPAKGIAKYKAIKKASFGRRLGF